MGKTGNPSSTSSLEQGEEACEPSSLKKAREVPSLSGPKQQEKAPGDDDVFVTPEPVQMEGKLQEEIMEREKLRYTYQDLQRPLVTKSYAQVASVPWSGPVGSETERKRISQKHETLLIKPFIEDKDKRTNDEIKSQLIEELKDVKNKLKIKEIKQMRKKELIIELDNKKDAELLKSVNLERKKLKIEELKRILPTAIVYDIETKYKVEDIQNDLISKKFDHLNEEELEKLRDKTILKYQI
ncbi:uncharacterized protein [Linepithema humile]|uniref:uncharacterized protein n=1 Tax=Linepithema humile TaxID=83485 RepID=UPI00351E638A